MPKLWLGQRMLKIDIHTHILPPEIPAYKKKFGYGGFIQLEHLDCCSANMLQDDGTFFRKIESNCWDPLARLKDCDEKNVSVQVLSTVPILFSYWAQPKHGLEVARYINEHIAGTVEKYPKRFVGLGTVPMQDVDLAIQELHRCVKDFGLQGVEIASHINGINLNDKSFFPFYAEAEKLGAALFIHPWDMMGKETMSEYWLPWLVAMPAETSRAICSMIFGGVFYQFPNLKVAFAHGGGSFPSTIGRIEHGFKVRPDLCAKDHDVNPREYLGKFFLDSLTHDEKSLRMTLELAGTDRIMLGSDYPFPLGEEFPGKLIEDLNLEESIQQKLLYQNALDWLGLTEQYFL